MVSVMQMCMCTHMHVYGGDVVSVMQMCVCARTCMCIEVMWSVM